MKYDVSIDTDARTCRVIAGPARRSYISTPRAVGAALLSSMVPEDDAASAATANVNWTDMLATHGLAIGTRGRQVVTLAAVAPKARQIHHSPVGDLTMTFPNTLFCLVMEAGRFSRALIFLIDPARQSQWGILSQTPVLVPFPYGNVYAESGRICWGTVNHADIHSIADLESLFFGSGFNNDLFFTGAAGFGGFQSSRNGTVLPPPATTTYRTTFPTALSQLLRG